MKDIKSLLQYSDTLWTYLINFTLLYVVILTEKATIYV